jgi:hypothetical protein
MHTDKALGIFNMRKTSARKKNRILLKKLSFGEQEFYEIIYNNSKIFIKE